MDIFSARTDAWRSEMQRGQDVAGSSRFPGEGNAVFTAPVSAWQRAMQRGQETLPSAVAVDHTGMTHQCNGCSDGAPCGNCGGNISKGDPALQALSWLMTMERARSVSDPFWGAARVSEAMQRTAFAGSIAQGAIQRLAWKAMVSGSSSPAGGSVSFQGPTITPSDGAGQLTVGATQPGINYSLTYGGDTRCCVVAFLYPVPKPKFKERVLGDGRTWIGWEFEVLAIFKDGGEENGVTCKCECCEFVQYANGYSAGTRGQGTPGEPGMPGKPGTPGKWEPTGKRVAERVSGEDCRVINGERVCYGKKSPKLKHGPESKNASWEIDHKSDGKGGQLPNAPPHIQALLDGILKEKELKKESVCVYYMIDYAGVIVSPGEHFEKNTCYRGEIWSTCPTYMMRHESFRLTMSGTSWGSELKGPLPFWPRTEGSGGTVKSKDLTSVSWDKVLAGDEQKSGGSKHSGSPEVGKC